MERWLVHVDRSTMVNSCGIGIVFTSPEGNELEFAVCVEFRTSNYEAEYEAIIRGLKIALKLGAKKIVIYLNLRLVTQQLGKTK